VYSFDPDEGVSVTTLKEVSSSFFPASAHVVVSSLLL